MTENLPDAEQNVTDDLVRSLNKIPSYLLTRIAHRHNKNVRDALKAVGLTTTAARVLVSLAIFTRLSVSDLCVYAVAEQPTMSRTLEKLAADGLIVSAAGPEDNRVRMIELTPDGEALYRRVWPVVSEHNERMMRGISDEDRLHMLRTLSRMLNNTRKNPL